MKWQNMGGQWANGKDSNILKVCQTHHYEVRVLSGSVNSSFLSWLISILVLLTVIIEHQNHVLRSVSVISVF